MAFDFTPGVYYLAHAQQSVINQIESAWTETSRRWEVEIAEIMQQFIKVVDLNGKVSALFPVADLLEKFKNEYAAKITPMKTCTHEHVQTTHILGVKVAGEKPSVFNETCHRVAGEAKDLFKVWADDFENKMVDYSFGRDPFQKGKSREEWNQRLL